MHYNINISSFTCRNDINSMHDIPFPPQSNWELRNDPEERSSGHKFFLAIPPHPFHIHLFLFSYILHFF